MLLSNIEFRDFIRYYNQCIVRDPRTGRPGLIKVSGQQVQEYYDPRSDQRSFGISVINGESFEKYKQSVSKYTLNDEVAQGTLLTTEYYDYPELGYRAVASGRGLFYLTRRRLDGGGLRGLSPNNIEVGMVAHPLNANLDLDYYTKDATLAFMVMQPMFKNYNDIVTSIFEQEGVITGALSGELAVIVSSEDDCDEFPLSLLYCNGIVGRINEAGKIKLHDVYKKLLGNNPLIKDHIIHE